MPIKKATKRRRSTKTRSSTKKKRSAIRRRIKYRKHSNWWRKYKGKKSKRKYKNGKLLKFTTKCSITDLLTWLYPNVSKIMAGASINVQTKNSTSMFAESFRNACIAFMRCLIAYDDRSVFGLREDPSTHAVKNATYFYAFNPIITRAQAGAFFNQMMNQYNWVKYVGLRVKWKPNVTKSSGVGAYGRNPANGYPLATNVVAGYGPALPTGVDQEARVQYDVPMKFYFNVIFNKDSYMDTPFYVRCLNVDYANVQNNNTPIGEYNGPTIMKRLKMYDTYDQTAVKVKKYCLSYPFKFYVRPYEQIQLSECGMFDGKAYYKQNQYANEYFQGVLGSLNNKINRDTHMGIPKPASWRRTQVFCPYWLEIKPTLTGEDDATIIKSTQYVNCLMNDSLYYNPVLFGYCFTADCKNRNKAVYTTSIEHVKTEHLYDMNDLDDAVSFAPLENMSNLGNFYFTIYLRFKGRRQNQIIAASRNLYDPMYNTEDNPTWY